MIRRTLKKFLTNLSGSIGINFALAVIPLSAGAGMAIDYVQGTKISAQVQAALDASVLATAIGSGTELERIAEGKKVFSKNFIQASGTKIKKIKIKIHNDGRVTGVAKTKLSTSLMKVLGFKYINLKNKSEARGGGLGKMEIVFVLDYSSSMNDQYEEMRDAAISLIDTITSNGSNSDVKVGLVPFAKQVFATMPGQYVVGGSTGVAWSNCTTDRKWPFVVTDRKPTASDNSKWGRLGNNESPTAAEYTSECADYSAQNLVLRPLTNDHLGTINQLNSMTPHEGTNLALGVEFGFQVISPKAPFTQGVSFNKKNWRKVIVVLSDGMHNKDGHGPGNIYTEEQGFANVNTTCENAKAKGVLMITVAYELDDEDGKEQLKKCASDASYYLESDSNTIAEKFAAIGNLLAGDAYLSK